MLTVPDVGWISSCLVHAATCESGRLQKKGPQAWPTQKPRAAPSWCGTASKTAARAQTRALDSIVATCFFSPHRHWIELAAAHPGLELALRNTNPDQRKQADGPKGGGEGSRPDLSTITVKPRAWPDRGSIDAGASRAGGVRSATSVPSRPRDPTRRTPTDRGCHPYGPQGNRAGHGGSRLPVAHHGGHALRAYTHAHGAHAQGGGQVLVAARPEGHHRAHPGPHGHALQRGRHRAGHHREPQRHSVAHDHWPADGVYPGEGLRAHRHVRRRDGFPQHLGRAHVRHAARAGARAPRQRARSFHPPPPRGRGAGGPHWARPVRLPLGPAGRCEQLQHAQSSDLEIEGLPDLIAFYYNSK